MPKEQYISWSHNNNKLKCTSKNSSKKKMAQLRDFSTHV